jgi:hypothetical protein
LSAATSPPSPAELAAFDAALAELDRESRHDLWKVDALAWSQDRLGESLWSKQRDIMASVDKPGSRTAVPSCNGSGKSFLASRAVARFIDTHEPGTAFVFTTAPRAQQVRAILWRYVRRAWKKGQLPGIVTQGMIPEWKLDGDIVGFGRKPADVDADTVMGIHEENLLIVLDEADGINAGLWDSLESLMTNADSCQVLAIGNPVDNTSRFARICDGTIPGWNIIRISAFDTPLFTGEPVPEDMAKTLVQPSWAEDKLTRWGRSSPLYIGKVLGIHPDAADGLIPMSWVRAAQHRWEVWFDQWDGHGAGDYEACCEAMWRGATEEPPGRRLISCDVATVGEDNTAIATKQGSIIMGVERFSGIETPEIVDKLAARLTHPLSHAIVDANGEGAGTYQVMRHDYPISPFKGSYATKTRDSSGVLKFPSWRVASWYHLRELLNPMMGATLALPPDDELAADLTTPKYESRTGGMVWVEDKDDIRKRLNRSTDMGDSVAMACWADSVGMPDTPQGEKRDQPRRPAVRRWAGARSWT